MTDIVYRAMMFAREKHKHQVRKYTGNPYTDHLAEVAGIASTALYKPEHIAVCWLHDVVEDQGVTPAEILNLFGTEVMIGVSALSDMETGNRKERKEKSCIRLGMAEGWIQTIKCADLISNTSSIVKHDPDFAIVYLKEKANLLAAMTKADTRLWQLAAAQVGENYVG